MSYEFQPDRIYRMPTHFGPAPGPRQRPDGSRWPVVATPETTTVWVTFSSDADAIDALLPPAFSVAQPDVRVEARYFRRVEWLGGRNYNIVGVYFDVVFHSDSGPVPGRLQAVVWENSPDAIISGREELGIPKLYAEIPDQSAQPADGRVSCSAAWDGYTFLEFEVAGLHDASPDSAAPEPFPTFQYKYVPRTGDWGEADVAYPVMTPGEIPNRRTLAEFRGDGIVSFTRGGFKELPTLQHVVDQLADLPVRSYGDAGVRETIGGKDLRDQRALSPEDVRAPR